MLSSFTALIGVEIIFGYKIEKGYTPIALQDSDPFKMFKKNSLTIILGILTIIIYFWKIKIAGI